MTDIAADETVELLRELGTLSASMNSGAGVGLGGVYGAGAEGTASALPRCDERRLRMICENVLMTQSAIGALARNPHVDPNDPFYAAAIAYLQAKETRDTRAGVGYLMWRLDTLSGLWWEAREDAAAAAMTAAERSFLRDYGALIVSYMGTFTGEDSQGGPQPLGLDLRAYTRRPPAAASQVMEVRGLTDYEFVSPKTGHTVSLYRGKHCCVSWSDAEWLLRRGIAEQVKAKKE